MGIIFDLVSGTGLKYTYEKEIKEKPIKKYKLTKEELEKYLNSYREIKYKGSDNE